MSTTLNAEKDQHKDPVCYMAVSSESEYAYHYSGEQYYFCSEHCLHKFKEQPEEYIEKKTSPFVETQSDTSTYTCPMHPEIRQQGPGTCPKCGMALEPVTFSGEEKNEELIGMSRRFLVCTVLALPLFFLAMIADMMPDWLPGWLSLQSVQWIEFTLATPVVLWGGRPFFVRGWLSM